jgi:tripartite-type tricarboxylate transporter receptor subunit TctC
MNLIQGLPTAMKHLVRALFLTSFTFVIFQFGSSNALAQSVDPYPSKTIRILVGFTPGGVPDITARYLATKLAENWKQAVVVENRLGAGSNVAAQALANAPADGYTLLSISSAHAVAPAIYAKLPFDAQKDFAGVTLTSTSPALVIVAPNQGIKTIADLIALAKAKPGQLNFASAGKGSGSHFAVELLKSQTGIDIVHIPYKGIPEALTETIAGRVQVFISPYASAVNLVKEGKAIAIAVTSPKRIPEMPELPTVAEAGVPGYEWVFWYGVLAPAKTPRAIVDKLQAEIATILKQPEVRQRFAPLGITAAINSPEEFDKLIANEIANFHRLAKAANIKPE